MNNRVIQGNFPRVVKHVKFFKFAGEPDDVINELNGFLINLELEKAGFSSIVKIEQFINGATGQMIVTVAVPGCKTTITNQPQSVPAEPEPVVVEESKSEQSLV